MGFWAANDKGVGKDLVERVRSSIANNNGWVEVGKKTAGVEEKDHGVREATSGIVMKGQKGAGTGGEGRGAGTGGAYLHQDDYPYAYMSYTTEFATSFAPVGMGGWDGGHEDRVKGAFEYMEGLYGTPIDTDDDGIADGYYYNTDVAPTGPKHLHKHLRMWATANLALGTVVDDATTARLYDGSLAREALSQPHLRKVTPSAPVALVRKAIFTVTGHNGTLELILTTPRSEGVKGCVLTIAVPGGWVRAEKADGVLEEIEFELSIDVSANDTKVSVPFRYVD